jgi:hypothetical protein
MVKICGYSNIILIRNIIIYLINRKTLSATDSYSDEYSYPKDDISNGGKNNLEVLGRDINNEGVTTVKFRRMLNTCKKK